MRRSLFSHPAPVEARLLREARLWRPLDQPSDRGAALPAVLARAATASALILASARAANPMPGRLTTLPVRVVHQASTQSCVACSLTSALECLRRETAPLSQMFHYHVTREKPGGADADGRLMLDVAIATIVNTGICRDVLHRSVFDAAGEDAPVSDEAVADARTRRLRPSSPFGPPRVRRLTGTARSEAVREEIRKDHPVAVQFTLPMGYPDADAFLNDDYEWCDERTPVSSLAQHCVLIVAFDDSRCRGIGAVQVFDSQGSQRFDGGSWWMAYRILDSAQVHQVVAFE